MSITPLRYAVLITLATGLAACNDGGGGGGSGDSGSSDPDFTRDVPEEDAEVKEDNADEVTDSSMRSAGTVVGQGSSGGYGTPDTRAASGASEGDSLVSSVRRFVETAREGASGPSTRATSSEDLDCDSGSGTVTYTYPDDDDTTSEDMASEGVEWTMDFDNCVWDETKYNGSWTLTFEDDYELDTSEDYEDYEYSWKVEYDDYRAEEADNDDLIWRAHGDMDLTFGRKTDDSEFASEQDASYYIISGDSFYVAYDDEVAQNRDYRLEYRIGEESGDFLFAYDTQASTTGTGGWITVETTDKFEWSSGNDPEEGELYIASGRTDDPTEPTYVRLEAQHDGNVPQYWFNSGSDESDEGSPKDFKNWDELISEL